MLNTTVKEFLARSISCILPGYGRVFVGISPAWGNASFANIIVHPKSEVEGYAVKLKPDEISKLDTSIGYPKMYNRAQVQLKKQPYNEGDPLIDGEVYIMIDKTLNSKYKRPSAEYLDATCKTLSASLYLKIGPYPDKKHQLSFKVFNGVEIKQDTTH
jgi:hypothetical protein